MPINIEISVNETFSFNTTLSILNINPDYCYIWFWRGFDYLWLEHKDKLLRMWVDYNTLLTTSAVMGALVSSLRYRMPKILKYNLDYGSLSNMMSFESTASIFSQHFSIVIRFKVNMTLLVVIVRPLLLAQMKSAITSDLMFLSALFILAICLLESIMNLSKLLELIGTRTCFLDGPLVIISSLSLFFLGPFKTL